MRKPLAIALCLTGLLVGQPGRAAANPWFGTWKLKLADSSQKPETLIYSDAGDGAMRMVSVEDKSVIITRFDGKPAIDIGTPAGRTHSLAVKAISPTSYSWTFSMAGKPFVQGTNTLASDLHSFKEVSWLVTKPDDVVTLIYERQ